MGATMQTHLAIVVTPVPCKLQVAMVIHQPSFSILDEGILEPCNAKRSMNICLSQSQLESEDGNLC